MKKHSTIPALFTSIIVLLSGCGEQGETALRLDEAIDDVTTSVLESTADGEARSESEEQLQAGKDAPPSAEQIAREKGEQLQLELRESLGLGN